MGNNHVDQGDTPGLLPIIEDYLTERAMNQLAEGNNVAAFIDVSGASAACLAQCMIKPGARHWLIEEGSPYIGKGGAMTLYHYTDKRFRAWGKSSKVLVPRLGSKIISGVSGVSWVILSYETYKCIKECQKSLCKDRKKWKVFEEWVCRELEKRSKKIWKKEYILWSIVLLWTILVWEGHRILPGAKRLSEIIPLEVVFLNLIILFFITALMGNKRIPSLRGFVVTVIGFSTSLILFSIGSMRFPSISFIGAGVIILINSGLKLRGTKGRSTEEPEEEKGGHLGDGHEGSP